MCPGEILSTDVRMDLRVGGSLVIVMRDAGGIGGMTWLVEP